MLLSPLRTRHAWSVLVVLSACAMRTPIEPAPRLAGDAPTAPYVVKVGDTLDIRFYKTPELNIEVPVRSDGKISLELLGDVQAAGLTPEQLSRTLTERYGAELINPRVSVIVRGFGGQIFVSGEVKSPKTVTYLNGMTALQAISDAGGFADTARMTDVILIRHTGSAYTGYRLTLKGALTGEDLPADVPLEPQDIVYVPKSRIGNLNLFVEQYIRNMLPINPSGFVTAF